MSRSRKRTEEVKYEGKIGVAVVTVNYGDVARTVGEDFTNISLNEFMEKFMTI